MQQCDSTQEYSGRYKKSIFFIATSVYRNCHKHFCRCCDVCSSRRATPFKYFLRNDRRTAEYSLRIPRTAENSLRIPQTAEYSLRTPRTAEYSLRTPRLPAFAVGTLVRSKSFCRHFSSCCNLRSCRLSDDRRQSELLSS
jgi:hypothetical protein